MRRAVVLLASASIALALLTGMGPSASADPDRGGGYRAPLASCWLDPGGGAGPTRMSKRIRWQDCPWLERGMPTTLHTCPKGSDVDRGCPAVYSVTWKRWGHRRAVGKGVGRKVTNPNKWWFVKVKLSRPTRWYWENDSRPWVFNKTRMRYVRECFRCYD